MPDYMFLLESRLSPEQRAAMMRVQELSAAMGFNVYLTGGTVRDLITGASLRDLDFTVEGNPSKMARELEKGGAKILHGGRKAAPCRNSLRRRHAKEAFRQRGTITMCDRARGRKFAGPRSWRICGGAIFR